MSKYIDAEKFYADAVRREKEAYQNLMLLDPENGKNEWIKWNAILNERTAFKHDIMDAPTADVEEVRHGEWIPIEQRTHWADTETVSTNIIGFRCSLCGAEEKFKYKYCHCGAKMDKEKEE